MTKPEISLNDRYDLTKKHVLLNGTQALVRLMQSQKERDKVAGLNTAGYVTGYRGSPLGSVDFQMRRAQKYLDASDITFQEGLNEDLAATAVWGTQQAELRGEGKFDGVFGLWYGKGPGVDRSGDVFRHANMAGTSPHGGVLACMGDDHTGESSTTLHQSEWAFVDAMMPIMSPAGVQEILDYSAFGYALSRYCGCWVGLKCVKDTIEVTQVVDADPHRVQITLPEDFDMPPEGVNIRLGDPPVAQEARMHDTKRFAAEAFGRANRLDKRVFRHRGAKIGIVSAGKNWLDLTQALSILGIDATEAERLGITTYKIAMTWPLDMQSFHDWAEDLELIIVVEEKRKLIEVQVKEAIFDDRKGRRVIGWKHDQRPKETVFSVKAALNPVGIAQKLAMLLGEEGIETDAIARAVALLDQATKADNQSELAARLPFFCSGCPHNSSTRLPEDARAYAGIGCHYMVQWMDRNTVGFTHMGGEGANWIGEAPFSTRDHVFQNLGDGTYNHSGVQAVRAALAADTNITYKILYNDAVAMTGGQKNDGDLKAPQIMAELKAMGVKNIVAVFDEKEEIDFAQFPSGIEKYPRTELMTVQRKMQKIKGVSAIVYIQTCAAEKRRRRKRGLFPDPDQRIFINPAVCEGCGDCGVQSNCVSIVPLETELGRKRKIDQSSCNKDFSCVEGFCPSFITVHGGTPKKPPASDLVIPGLPQPQLPTINGTHNTVITGVGGTGVVTVGAVLAMAAHIEGKGVGVMEMAGLAQKGGAVAIHCRIAQEPKDISAIRIALGEADSVIGGDLVVTTSPKTLGQTLRGRTRSVCNIHEIITGEFTRNINFALPADALISTLTGRLGEKAVSLLDATALATRHLGDSIYANIMVLGAAWQKGLVPLGYEAILKAIELNGAAVSGNQRAFEIGRWAVEHPGEAKASLNLPHQAPKTLKNIIAFRTENLRAYQNNALAGKYQAFLSQFSDPELKQAAAISYHKLLSYKDEYEVARLHHDQVSKMIDEEFDNVRKLEFHLAPPLLSGQTALGRPKKRRFGPWILPVFGLLKKLKFLRGTPFDPFGYGEERKMERALIRQYEKDMAEVLNGLTANNHETALALAELPRQIRGFGPIKLANIAKVAEIREELLKVFRSGGPTVVQAAE